MFCTNCGTKLPDGAQFCTNCGARMEAATPAPAPVSESAPVPATAAKKPVRRLIIKEDGSMEGTHVNSGVFSVPESDLSENAPAAAPVKTEPVYVPPVEAAPVYTAPVAEDTKPEPVYVPPVKETAPVWPEYTPPVKEEAPAAPVWPEYAPPAAPAAPAAPVRKAPVATPAKKVPAAPVKAPTTAEKRAGVKPVKAKKKSPLPIIIIVVLLLAAAAAAAWFFLLSPETVYVVEKYEYTFGDDTMEVEYEYDENGLLLSYQGMRESCEYEYEDGRIVAASIESVNVEVELEYIYEDDVLVEIVGEGDDVEVEATCDEDGRIEEIVVKVGDAEQTFAYTYDDEGNVEEEIRTNGDHKDVYTYENGLLMESTNYYDGEQTWRTVYTYDEEGNVIKQVSYNETDDVYQTMECEYTYDDEGRILSYSSTSEYADGMELEYSYEVEWEDDTFAMVTVDGHEGDAVAYMEWEYDENGNHIRTSAYDEDAELVYEQIWTYTELKVPRNYEEPDLSDPAYFLGILEWF